MAGAIFRRNPGWADQVRRSVEMASARKAAAKDVADEAQRIGREVADTYECEVEDDGERARVLANTHGRNNAAGWIEVGTGPPAPTPAYAPLRKGAEHAGLKTGRPRR